MGFSALVITADLEARKQFKERFPVLMQFDKIQYSCSLTEASQKLDGHEPVDVVMISSRFSGDVINQFIAACKRKPSGSASAYVLLFDMRESSIDEMLSYPTECADGFLFEPYTITDVREQVTNARIVSTQRGKQNMELAIERHIARLLTVIDETAERCRGNIAPKNALGAIRSSTRFFEDLSEAYQAEYFERLAIRSAERQPAAPRKNLQDRNASSQTRQRVIRKR